jgi:SEC-C motif domain protein
MKISLNAPCPCHSGAKYKKCCRPYHDGTPAPTPEALMRSRYSAYALGKSDYIMHTTHSESPHRERSEAVWRASLDAFARHTRFEGLAVLAVGANTVTFNATLTQHGRDVSFTEHSVFRQEAGQWRYVSARDKG